MLTKRMTCKLAKLFHQQALNNIQMMNDVLMDQLLSFAFCQPVMYNYLTQLYKVFFIEYS